jgi:hypothetical protein
MLAERATKRQCSRAGIPWDLPAELRTTVECLLEVEIRLAIESLERAAQVTEENLRQELRSGRN